MKSVHFAGKQVHKSSDTLWVCLILESTVQSFNLKNKDKYVNKGKTVYRTKIFQTLQQIRHKQIFTQEIRLILDLKKNTQRQQEVNSKPSTM